jgi:hypothetical protein
MPLPTAYTESELKTFMLDSMEDMAGELGWDASSKPVDLAVNSTVRNSGVSDIAAVTDVRRLELVAIREIWSFAASSLASRIDYTNTNQGQFQQEKLYEHAIAEIARADNNLRQYDQSQDDGGGPGTEKVKVYDIVRTPACRVYPQRYWWNERNV